MTRTLRPCGTHAGHQRHYSHCEPPCEACIVAERAYQRARYLRDKARARVAA